jgi:hypothetical protein
MLSLIHEFLVVRTLFIVRDNSSVRNTFQPLMQKAVTLRTRNGCAATGYQLGIGYRTGQLARGSLALEYRVGYCGCLVFSFVGRYSSRNMRGRPNDPIKVDD